MGVFVPFFSLLPQGGKRSEKLDPGGPSRRKEKEKGVGGGKRALPLH